MSDTRTTKPETFVEFIDSLPRESCGLPTFLVPPDLATIVDILRPDSIRKHRPMVAFLGHRIAPGIIVMTTIHYDPATFDESSHEVISFPGSTDDFVEAVGAALRRRFPEKKTYARRIFPKMVKGRNLIHSEWALYFAVDNPPDAN